MKAYFKNNISYVIISLFLSFNYTSCAQKIPLQIVWLSGNDDYHTYLIPALIVTIEGTLLAFCEGRKNSQSDAHFGINLLSKNI